MLSTFNKLHLSHFRNIPWGLYYKTFDTSDIIWHGIDPVFVKIYADLKEIAHERKIVCYCFWEPKIVQKQ